MTLDIRTTPDAIDAAWLTDALAQAGALAGGRVVDVHRQAVGTGQMGDSVRFTLTYEGTPGPPTVVGKFPSSSQESRQNTATTRAYEIECRFYQGLHERVGIRVPRPYLSLWGPEHDRFVLLLEDLAPAEQGDQIAGCDQTVAELALDELAKLHAPVWAAPDLVGVDWLDRATPESAAFTVMLFQGFWPGFQERYGDRLDADVAADGGALIGQMAEYVQSRQPPYTVTHGDYRLDNMLFGTGQGGAPMATVDWQTASLGPAVTDVAYFMGTSPRPEVRAAHEERLVRRYWQALVDAGVEDFAWEECWRQYRLYAYAGFLMAVAASMLVGQTDRGDEMFMAMANRSGRMAIELDSRSLL